MIDWNLAPEGATMIISSDKELRWANKDGQWVFNKVDGWKFLTGNPLKLSCWKVIATRPTQTKTVADAVEQEGEKWTHVYCSEKCKVVGEPDSFGRVVILTESDAYFLDKPENLKPIKPTLTKAEAWDRMADSDTSIITFHDKYEELKEQYDII